VTDARARLEATLREPKGMTYDNLVVYADFLQGEGDPRGELLALDLVAPNDRYAAGAAEWRARRRVVLVEWLGATVADELGDAIDLGFVKTLDGSASAAALASPACDYLRGFTVAGERPIEGLLALAARPRPWLTQLAITSPAWTKDPPLVDAELSDRLVAAAPHLARLALHGVAVMAKLAHPTLRYLALDHAQCITPFEVALPKVRQLELAISQAQFEGGAADDFQLAPELFPALEAIDLGQVEREQDWLFDWVRGQPCCRELKILDLPALADATAVVAAQRLLDACPRLVASKVRRTYGRPIVGQELAKRVPPVEIPAPFPWPSPETLKAWNSLVIKIPEEPFDDIVAMDTLIAFLERTYDRFEPAVRDAWAAIFAAARPTDWAYDEETGEYTQPEVAPPVTWEMLQRAVKACDPLAEQSRSWAKFRAHLHETRGLEPTELVGLAIYRG